MAIFNSIRLHPLHRWLQYLTSSQFFSHFFRQAKGLPQVGQILVGKCSFLTPFIAWRRFSSTWAPAVSNRRKTNENHPEPHRSSIGVGLAHHDSDEPRHAPCTQCWTPEPFVSTHQRNPQRFAIPEFGRQLLRQMTRP